MSDKKKIWIGPGVLRPGPDSKRKNVVEPGEEITKGVITSDRLKQLEKAGKIVSSADYAQSMAAAGVAPVENAAGKIKALEVEIKELQAVNETLKGGDEGLASVNKELQKTNEDLVSGSVELQETNKALEAEIKKLKEVKK